MTISTPRPSAELVKKISKRANDAQYPMHAPEIQKILFVIQALRDIETEEAITTTSKETK